MPDLVKLLEQWAVVTAAPIPFAIAVVVAGGLIWFAIGWSYSSLLSGKTAQIELLDRQLADYRDKPKMPSTSDQARSPKSEPSKNYFPAEKVELGNLLSDLSTILNKQGLQAFNLGYRFGGEPLQTKDQLSGVIKRVDTARLLISEVSRELWDDAVQKNPKYRTEISEVLGSNDADNVPVGPFLHQLNTFHRDLSVFAEKYDVLGVEVLPWIGEMVDRDARNAQRASVDFNAWIQHCNERIDAKRELLR